MADYKKIISTIKEKEGGVSNAKTDTASLNPSPCTYQGKSNIHTNQGITWQTFIDSSKAIGYKPNCELFIKMPKDIWAEIFKRDFWDRYDLDLYKSQAIADFIGYIAFHFGVTGSRLFLVDFFKSIGYSVDGKNTIRQSVDKILQDPKKEVWLLDKMMAYLENYYKSSSQKQNIDGWLNALKKFRPYVYSQLKPVTTKATVKKIEGEVKTNVWWYIGGITAISLTIGLIVYYKNLK